MAAVAAPKTVTPTVSTWDSGAESDDDDSDTSDEPDSVDSDTEPPDDEPADTDDDVPDDPDQTYWIEIELVGEDGQPIPGEEYQVVLPTQEIVKGKLDQTGWARVEDIQASGTCQVTFPRLDEDAWQMLTALPARP